MQAIYTSRTVKLPDGIEIFYYDSGPVPDSTDYTTLIILHGMIFNSTSFFGLYDLAAKYNTRIVLPNRREYSGSTKFTDAELDDLKNGRKVFLERLALHNAWFIENFVKNENVPKPSDDGKSGGIALMGWSMGNVSAVVTFSDPNIIPAPLYQTIEPYLTSLIMYEPSSKLFGYSVMDGFYHPSNDKTLRNREEIYEAMLTWLGSYYQHPDLSSVDIQGLDNRKSTGRRTLDTWTDDQKKSSMERDASARVDNYTHNPSVQPVLQEYANNALFNESLATSYFPRLKVIYICASESCWPCPLAYNQTVRVYKEAKARGEKVREMRFRMLPKGNHFVHSDLPELFLQVTVEELHA